MYANSGLVVFSPNFNTIEIRTLDDRTGITSPIFVGGPSAPTSMLNPGINGFLRWDANGDNRWITPLI